MILRELLEIITEDSLTARLSDVTKDLNAIKAKMDMSKTLAISLQPTRARLEAEKRAILQKQSLRNNADKNAEESKKKTADALNAVANRSKEEKKEANSKAISHGLKDNKEKRDEDGGSPGQAANWLAYVRASSKGGEKVTGADLAQHFGINARSVNKRLELPAYKAVRSALGR